MAFEEEVKTAVRLAEEAGAIALDYQRAGISAEWKPDDTPVTAADKACEKLIVDGLTRTFPEDGLLGEEGANRKSCNGRRWIIDPIDGTRDFIRGIPLWTVLIGLEEDSKIVAGVAFNPTQQLLMHASRGGGTFANGNRVSVSSFSDPKHSLLAFNGFNKPGTTTLNGDLLQWVARFSAVRSLGGSSDAMLLAQGKADVWIEPNAAPWDLAPLKILIEEAGGKFATFKGENTIYGGNCYACTPGLESYVLQLVSG
jgi:histidinol-phosphatase